MAESLSFTCSCCGEAYRGLPSFGCIAPDYYRGETAAGRGEACSLTEDLCTVGGQYFFVRGVLEVPILGTDTCFGWGVWSSLSEANFKRYVALFDAEEVAEEAPYFGWLSNRLPEYPSTLNLKLDVHLQNGGLRPLFELHPQDHPLAEEQRTGISRERAVALAERLLHPERNGQVS